MTNLRVHVALSCVVLECGNLCCLVPLDFVKIVSECTILIVRSLVLLIFWVENEKFMDSFEVKFFRMW